MQISRAFGHIFPEETWVLVEGIAPDSRQIRVGYVWTGKFGLNTDTCERGKGSGFKKIRISVDWALVLKVRVFGTRRWPIIISDGSGRIKVYRPGLYGLNRDRAGRSPELLRVRSTRSYFTLASVAMKDITVQFRKANFVKTDVLIIFFTGGDKLFLERRI